MLSAKFLPKKQFYLACSGGVDSVAIFSFLIKKRIDFKVFHFNHKFQAINEQMEESVRKMCADFGIECVVHAPPVGHTLRVGSIEDQLRELRLDAMRSLNADVVTCHHLDDCVESYFMNCFRMKQEFVPIPICTKLTNSNTRIIRPFMLSTKNDMTKNVFNNGMSAYVVNDPTNTETKYYRNWIRHEVIPMLNNRQLNVTTGVAKRMQEAYNKFLAK